MYAIMGIFLSTLPARGATEGFDQKRNRKKFLATLPARGATFLTGALTRGSKISIHAPREGSDLMEVTYGRTLCLISIHAPREGSDT